MLTAPPLRHRTRMGGVRYSSNTPISLEELRHIAPSVFAEEKHCSRSDKFTFIPTTEMLKRLMSEGFQPYAISQGGSSDPQKKYFTKHLIRLRHERSAHNNAGVQNEVIIKNAHDGTSLGRIMAGAFRFICENGLIIASSLIEDVAVPHKGDVVGRIIDGCVSIVDRFPKLDASIQRMASITLTREQEIAFANEAITIRYGKDTPPVTVDQVLMARRFEDAGSSLWKVFNRTQENLLRGGLHYHHRTPNGRLQIRQTRAVNAIDANTNMNRALWKLAEDIVLSA